MDTSGSSFVGFEIENLKKQVKPGTEITFAKDNSLGHGIVTAVYKDFFMVEEKVRNKFGTNTLRRTFSWAELAIWELELKNRVDYRDKNKTEVKAVFLSSGQKEKEITPEDLKEKTDTPSKSTFAKIARKEEAEKRKKEKRAVKKPVKSPKLIEAAAYQKECEKRDREAGMKKQGFTRIYHKCPELLMEKLKKGQVLLGVKVSENRSFTITSCCITRETLTNPWVMPKGRNEDHHLFWYEPVHYLAYTDPHGSEDDCPAETIEEWRRRFEDRDTYISIYSEETDLMDVWISYQDSDMFGTGCYDRKQLKGYVMELLSADFCYVSTDRANFYGPLECRLAEKVLRENEDLMVGFLAEP